MTRTKPSVLKRLRERDKREKREEKDRRRAERKQASGSGRPTNGDVGIDPDIAHIIPGPQPLPEEDEI